MAPEGAAEMEEWIHVTVNGSDKESEEGRSRDDGGLDACRKGQR